MRLRAEEGGALLLVADGRAWRRDPAGRCEAIPPPPLPPPSPVEVAGETWRATPDRGIERVRRLFRRVEIAGISNVNAIALAPDGSVWCGTEDGLARLVAGRVERTKFIGSTRLTGVTACAVDREGRVWIGSGGHFTGAFRRDGESWTRVGAAEGFVDAHVHRITCDPTGALWFAVLNAPSGDSTEGAGAFVYSGGLFRPAAALQDLPSSRVYDVIARDAQGVLWFATLRGLASHEGNHVTQHGGLLSERVFCLEAARDGSLWIGYQKSALGLSRLARGAMTHFSAPPCDVEVWSIEEGERDVLWFATNRGLLRHDGIRWSRFDAGPHPLWPLLPMADGSLYVGTLGGGLLRFEPDDRDAPRTGFLPGEGVRWGATDAWWKTPPEEILYRWRVDGGRWSDPSPATELPGPLTEGPHRVEVQAIDLFGNAESPPALLEVAATTRSIPWPAAAAAAATVALAAAVAIARRASARKKVP